VHSMVLATKPHVLTPNLAGNSTNIVMHLDNPRHLESGQPSRQITETGSVRHTRRTAYSPQLRFRLGTLVLHIPRGGPRKGQFATSGGIDRWRHFIVAGVAAVFICVCGHV
jgi:hypothetical protein